MKPTTGKLLIEVLRNVKGIVTLFERWVRQESHIGSVSLGKRPESRSDGDSSQDSED